MTPSGRVVTVRVIIPSITNPLPSSSTMSTSTEKLAEDIDGAVRDAYQAIRAALNRVEDLKMMLIGKTDIKAPFTPKHDEMYTMYLDLSKRFQDTREEMHRRSGPAQPRPPAPSPAPRTDKPSTTKPPPQRNKSRPYVLIPVCLFHASQKTILIHHSHEVPFLTPSHHRLTTAPIGVNGPPQRRKTCHPRVNEKQWNQRMTSPSILKANKVPVTARTLPLLTTTRFRRPHHRQEDEDPPQLSLALWFHSDGTILVT